MKIRQRSDSYIGKICSSIGLFNCSKILLILCCCITRTISDHVTCMATADFQTYCATKKGVVVGSQCFFNGGEAIYDDAWTLCDGQDSALAQIQTQLEFDTISTTFISLNSVRAMWVAMHRTSVIPDGSPSIDLTNTQWLCPIKDDRFQLYAGLTYVRAHQNDDVGIQGVCYILYYKNVPSGVKAAIGDTNCGVTQSALCQITNKQMKYTRMDTCLTEKPISDLSNILYQDCLDECTIHMWCRSVNVYTDNRCQLFTWDIKDTNRKQIINGCFHYTYQP